jgi:hypothetical protein
MLESKQIKSLTNTNNVSLHEPKKNHATNRSCIREEAATEGSPNRENLIAEFADDNLPQSVVHR